jgi:TatA/E family protein of Tat protein translocase
LLLFGPKKLPELARSTGKATGEYHKAAREIEDATVEVKKPVKEIEKERRCRRYVRRWSNSGQKVRRFAIPEVRTPSPALLSFRHHRE